MGYSFPSPRAGFPPPVPSRPARWVPARGLGAKGGVTQHRSPQAGAERGRGGTRSSSLTCALVTPPAPSSLHDPILFVPGGPRRRRVRSKDAPSPAESTPAFAKLAPRLCKTQNDTPKPTQRPISVSSAVSGNNRDGPTTVSVPSRSGCACPRGGCGKAVPGWGSDFGVSCRAPSATPAGFQLLAERSGTRPPAPSELSRCAAQRQKYFPSCCPPGA